MPSGRAVGPNGNWACTHAFEGVVTVVTPPGGLKSGHAAYHKGRDHLTEWQSGSGAS
jgi:hypothetical protein